MSVFVGPYSWLSQRPISLSVLLVVTFSPSVFPCHPATFASTVLPRLLGESDYVNVNHNFGMTAAAFNTQASMSLETQVTQCSAGFCLVSFKWDILITLANLETQSSNQYYHQDTRWPRWSASHLLSLLQFYPVTLREREVTIGDLPWCFYYLLAQIE